MLKRPIPLLMATGILVLVTGGVLSAVARTGPGAIAEVASSATELESWQARQIRKTYVLNTLMRPNRLSVSVNDGTATLAGSVDTLSNRDLAGRIAMGVEGIRVVDNRLSIQAAYPPTTSGAQQARNTPANSDAVIVAAANATLQWSEHRQSLAADVASQSGAVTLTGTAKSQWARDYAGRRVAAVPGVVSVDNQLVVKEQRWARLAADMWGHTAALRRNLADRWITARVKTNLLFAGLGDRPGIAVSTQGGVVHLEGVFDSDDQHAQALELTQNIHGVRDVRSSHATP